MRVSGLPAGVRPVVVLSGPKGFHRRAIASQRALVRNLRPGAYRLRVMPLSLRRSAGAAAAGARVLPIAANVRFRVGARRTTVARAGYGTVVNPGLVRLRGPVLAVTGPPENPSAITVAASVRIRRGQTIGAAPSAALPNGLLHRVTEVTRQGAQRTLNLEPQTLSEVVPTLRFSGAVDVSSGGQPGFRQTEGNFSAGLELVPGCTYSFGGALRPLLSVSDVRPNLDINVNPWSGPVRANVTVSLQVVAGYRLITSRGFECELSQSLFTGVSVIVVAGVPIPVYLDITVGGRVRFDDAVSVERTAETRFEVGARTRRAGLVLVPVAVYDHGPTTVRTTTKERATFQASLALGAELGLGTPGSVNVHTKVESAVRYTREPQSCTVNWDVGTFDAGGRAGPFKIATPSFTAATVHLWKGCAGEGLGGGELTDATIPVSSCPFTFNPFPPEDRNPVPSSLPARISAADAAAASFFANGDFALLGPKDFGCTSITGGDGTLKMLVAPGSPVFASDGGQKPAQAVYGFEVFRPRDAADLACPYFSAAVPDSGGDCGVPAGEIVRRLDENAVLVTDPPGVQGGGYPSGGANTAKSVVLYDPTFGSAAIATCTLPAAQESLCDASLAAFRARTGRSSNP